MNIGDRIKRLRKEKLQLTQANFGEKIGLKATAIGQMESGDRNVTDRTILLICNAFNVNEEWIRTGIEPMFVPMPNDELKQLAQKHNFNDIEYKFLYEYLKLDSSKRHAVVEFLENILNSNASLLATKENTEFISDESDKLSDIDKEVAAFRSELEAESKGEISSALEKPKGA